MTEENKQKHCTQCGSLISEGDKFCGDCGAKILNEEQTEKVEDVNSTIKEVDDEMSTNSNKIGCFNETKQKKDGFAKIGLAFGILSIFLWEFSIFPILAIVFSGLGISRTIKKQNAGLSMAIWGIILGILYLAVRISEL